jgi:ketosteroid isomerase-like protein
MRRVSRQDFVLMILIVLLTPIASRSQSSTAAPNEKVLIQLERDWDQAFHQKNISFIKNVVADEYIGTYDDGARGNRNDEIENAANFDKHIDSATLDEFTVKEYGDTAVVWFRKRMTGPMKGKPVTISLRFVDVFVMRAGRWQCVASQSTRIAD